MTNKKNIVLYNQDQEKAQKKIKKGRYKKMKKIDYEIEDDILDYRYFTDINNSLIISGLYRAASESRAGEKNISGNFYLEMDASAKIAQQNYNQFKEKLYNVKINSVINDNTDCVMLCEFLKNSHKVNTHMKALDYLNKGKPSQALRLT